MNASTDAAPAEKGASTKTQRATLGGGCFWCVEAVFERLEGVHAVVSGYAGGTKPNPAYREVCNGTTQHAEVIQIEFDPSKITFERLLEVFWDAHDPTTLNRQGADTGTQYRSIILWHDEEQRKTAEKSKRAAASRFSSPIVTEIVAFEKFYPAEDYHQDYFRNNPNQPYCAVVIRPKLQKLFRKDPPGKPTPKAP
jgi:peptide-methionine (S)-S-oxide reductase